MNPKRAKHILFKAYPGSWIIEGVLKTQAQIAALHYGRGEETTKITPELIRNRLTPAYIKIAQALSLHFGEEFNPNDLYGLSLDHDLVSGQLKISIEHRVGKAEQKYNIEFSQAAGNWTLPERCLTDSNVEDRLSELARIRAML